MLDSGPVIAKKDSSEDTCLKVAKLARSMMDLNARMTPCTLKKDTGGNGRTRRTKIISYPFVTPSAETHQWIRIPYLSIHTLFLNHINVQYLSHVWEAWIPIVLRVMKGHYVMCAGTVITNSLRRAGSAHQRNG